MNPSMHLFHPTPPHIEVSFQHSKITILKSMHAVSPDHAKTVQMTQWDCFNLLDINQKHNGQTWHPHGHEQSSLQEQPKDSLLSKESKLITPMLLSNLVNKQFYKTHKNQDSLAETLERTILIIARTSSLKTPSIALIQCAEHSEVISVWFILSWMTKKTSNC